MVPAATATPEAATPEEVTPEAATPEAPSASSTAGALDASRNGSGRSTPIQNENRNTSRMQAMLLIETRAYGSEFSLTPKADGSDFSLSLSLPRPRVRSEVSR